MTMMMMMMMMMMTTTAMMMHDYDDDYDDDADDDDDDDNRVATFLENLQNLEKSGNFVKSGKSQGKQAKSGKSQGNHDYAILSASITIQILPPKALRIHIFSYRFSKFLPGVTLRTLDLDLDL